MAFPKQVLTVTRSSLPAWQAHKKSWDGCKKCPLHANGSKYVLVRGVVPAEILFIGEAPGPVEDAGGFPFLGPSGLLLQKWIEEGGLRDLRYAITNTVACLPLRDPEVSGVDVRAPNKDEVKACSPRLVSLSRIVQPKAVVYVGKVSASSQSIFKDVGNKVEIPHPAHVLRLESLDESQFLLQYRRAVYQLQSLAMILDHPF